MRDTENLQKRVECVECGDVGFSDAGHGETIGSSRESPVWCPECDEKTLHNIDIIRE